MTKPITNELFVVASSRSARRFPQESLLAVWSGLDASDIAALSGKTGGEWPLPELTAVERSELLNRYYNVIASVGLENGSDSLWWYTWTASRDRFLSTVLDDMELLARFRKACQEGLPPHLVLVCPDPYLGSVLISVAKQNGVRHRISLENRLRWARRWLKMQVRPFYSGFKTGQRAFAQNRRRRADNGWLGLSGNGEDRTMIVTWLNPKNLLGDGPANDTYFGRLPEYLRASGRSAVLFGDLLSSPRLLPKAGKIDEADPVLAASEFYDAKGVIWAILRALFSPIRLPRSLQKNDPGLTSLIKRDIFNNRGAVAYGLLFESSLSRACREFRPSRIIHSCENNPWEKACVRVAEGMSPSPDVIGFMHCAVLLSHPKIVITEEEKTVRPRPKKLVCTGPKARDIMIRRGGHSPQELLAGTALRHEYLWEMSVQRKQARSTLNVLVALDGLPTMPGFVRFLFQALDGSEAYDTVLRPHPIDTADRIMVDSGMHLSAFKTLKFSQNQSLGRDLENADVLVYKGSTVAIEAGYLGIPLVHVDLNSLLNNDPLFEVDHLKQVVRTPEELVVALDRVARLDEGDYLQESAALRNYIDEYFVRPTEDSISAFLPPTLVGANAP